MCLFLSLNRRLKNDLVYNMYKLIKLDATTSTNDFLKSLNNHVFVENFTVVRADFQSNGKGQMGATWTSEKSKNLITSILVREKSLTLETLYDLNRIVSVSLLQVLFFLKIPALSVKWPNDIMSGNKKIAGILIENIIKANDDLVSIIGIGLNVNQKTFKDLDAATSMKLQSNQDFDLDSIMEKLIITLRENLDLFNKNKSSFYFNDLYHQHLFKKDVPCVFQNLAQEKFMGIIREVTSNGQLKVELEDDSVQTFDVKQIKMIF